MASLGTTEKPQPKQGHKKTEKQGNDNRKILGQRL